MTTTAPPPAPQAPVERAPHGDGDRAQLARPRKGRPQNFGLNVRRLRRVRAICFAVLAVPLLILALLIVRFVSMPITQAWHDDAYDDGDYPAAAERLGPVSVVNWFEPYLPHLTRGTDLLQEGRHAEAEAELRVSLQKWSEGKDLNQPMHAQCKIINNLAISIERQAQEIEDPAQRADRLFEAEQLRALAEVAAREIRNPRAATVTRTPRPPRATASGSRRSAARPTRRRVMTRPIVPPRRVRARRRATRASPNATTPRARGLRRRLRPTAVTTERTPRRMSSRSATRMRRAATVRTAAAPARIRRSPGEHRTRLPRPRRHDSAATRCSRGVP